GEFRMDLYYRLNGFTLHMPALRDRKDREELIRAIAAEENDGLGVEIAPEALDALLAYSWPGNIRELRNVLRMVVALAEGMTLNLAHLPQLIQESRRGTEGPAESPEARAAAPGTDERAMLIEALTRKHWRIGATAASLGISRNTLYRKLHAHGLMDRK
ncbi:MAG TPA: helix-turn-helix domain-containing protein, partial [Acetobacteraceae bacterium]|nr:helix-turn-helix domain-containing protein [Acetobacteraceae bacterium]